MPFIYADDNWCMFTLMMRTYGLLLEKTNMHAMLRFLGPILLCYPSLHHQWSQKLASSWELPGTR